MILSKLTVLEDVFKIFQKCQNWKKGLNIFSDFLFSDVGLEAYFAIRFGSLPI